MFKKLSSLVLVMFVGCLAALGQIITPLTWKSTLTMQNETEGVIKLKAHVEDGWHFYALQMPDDGPMATQFGFDKLEGVELVGDITPSQAPKEEFDNVFNLNLGWWGSDVTFSQKFKITSSSGRYAIEAYVYYQACNEETCVMPTKETFEFHSAGFTPKEEEAVVDTVMAETATEAPVAAAIPDESGWWESVTFPETGELREDNIADSSWWYIFLWGFVGGLIALLTPCVWPMIPLTVSFFLKKNGSKAQSVRDAVIYGASIIVIYLVLGLAITVLFGASKLNDLATNAVFNLLFFLLLVVFAISFFGGFDIKLPSRWSNSMDSKAERTTGLLSIFFMAFTLVLVSFSCTGPIIGTLLVEAASVGDYAGPAVGMGAFALALAIPFALFAMFPSMLKEMPRSGGWLNSVKVVLGFLELALSLKFLSVADLAYGWRILDREVFIALWVIIFILLGCYLLGKIRFSHDTPSEHVGITRFFLSMISLSFAVYLLPGLWGAPLKSVSAFVPPLFTQDFNLYGSGNFRQFDDYDEGMKYAAETGRPVLMDFSGYGCVNCRKMEGAVFDAQEIKEMIRDNFVLIELMVDDKKPLPKEEVVTENGKKLRLTTYGEKWSYLQRNKFAANSQPYYVILDNSGNAISTPYYYDESIPKFAKWLSGGIDKYNE